MLYIVGPAAHFVMMVQLGISYEARLGTFGVQCGLEVVIEYHRWIDVVQ